MGWLAIAEDGDRASEVTVRLGFGERSVEPKMRRQAPEDRDPLAEGVSTTLESIHRQLEEGAGKVDPHTPPAGTEPQTGENPAVVDEDR